MNLLGQSHWTARTGKLRPLDVHKETVAIAYALGSSREDAIYHGECGGSSPTVERGLRKLAKKLEVKLQDLKVCYEAGPTGFVLARLGPMFSTSRAWR